MNADLRTGLIAGFTAYVLWGSLPIYFRALGHIGPGELLAHRIIWSLPTGLIFIALASQWDRVRAVLTPAKLGWLALSALLIGANWLVYIYAVSVDRVMEASIGYYINPLVSVLLGLVLFSERLRRAQWLAVALACIGVAVLTQAFGQVPWIALALCFLFAFYGAIRKKIGVEGRTGFVIEAAILFPAAAFWLTFLVARGESAPMGRGGWDIPLLLASGPITAVPLICFAVAASRLKLSTVGMMQYIAPTLQFLIALFIFREPFSGTHALAFAFIWLALVVFTADSVIGNARARRLARAAQLS
jgi:chloramphenicol-sensitive protein RarD